MDPGQGSGSGGGTTARDGGRGAEPTEAGAPTDRPRASDDGSSPADTEDRKPSTPTEADSGTPSESTKSDESAERRALGGDQGKSVGNDARATEEGSTPAGATAAESRAASTVVEAESEHSSESGLRAENPTRSTDIELPEFDVEAMEGDDAVVERAIGAARATAHPLSGIWEQIEGDGAADFGPGGYERSVVMLNPATGTAAVYRIFRGSIAMVMGGELALEVQLAPDSPRKGSLTLRTDPSLASRFPSKAIALGGNPPRFADPPSGASPWSLDWSRDGARLRIGAKSYRPITRDRFEEIRRGGADAAQPDELVETAPERPQGRLAAGTGDKPRETSFFGVVGGGKRFVFIVDVSGSMLGPKLDRMKAELEKSVTALPADVDFSIVFFASGAQVIDQGWMQSGRDTQRAVEAIRRQGCIGGTDPSGAFQFCFSTLSPIPDCIFFMTDGQIPPNTPDLVRQLNSSRIPTVIHTIGFGDAAEEPMIRPLLEQIANENKGRFEFVLN